MDIKPWVRLHYGQLSSVAIAAVAIQAHAVGTVAALLGMGGNYAFILSAVIGMVLLVVVDWLLCRVAGYVRVCI